ncbi:MAG TPA: transporter substrate-binding domain-containing protein [Castellaniella sp.]|uniref:transporter substrate-binding domain-containing protein n=1 Tax=Castellaniella sp. TaxID=1955812 RepID=UPI002F02F3D1
MRIAHLHKWLLASACLAVAGFSLPAQADQLADIQKAGTLTIGTEMQFAPFDFLKDGKQEGFNKEFFAQVGKALGVKVHFIDLPWASVLPGLDANKFDLVGGPLNVTKARKARYHFTLPIADGTVAFLKRAKDTAFTKPEDVAGKVVGSQRGSSQLEQTKAYVDTLKPVPQVREYVDFNQAYADLANGRIMAVGNSITNIAVVAKERPDTFALVKPSFGKRIYYAFMGHKGANSDSLIAAIDKVILDMHKDGRLAALQKKWFGTEMEVPTADFTPNV